MTAWATDQSLLCKCCGQYADEAHDPETEGQWEVVDDEVICYAGAALEQWRKDDGPKHMEDGALAYVRRSNR